MNIVSLFCLTLVQSILFNPFYWTQWTTIFFHAPWTCLIFNYRNWQSAPFGTVWHSHQRNNLVDINMWICRACLSVSATFFFGVSVWMLKSIRVTMHTRGTVVAWFWLFLRLVSEIINKLPADWFKLTKMGKKVCAVSNCNNTSDVKCVSFYDSNRRWAFNLSCTILIGISNNNYFRPTNVQPAWIAFCARAEPVTAKSSFICSEHFLTTDFINASCLSKG